MVWRGRTVGSREFGAIVAILIVFVAIFLPLPSRIRESRRSACVLHLKTLGVVLEMYAKENNGRYPRVQGPDPWFVDGSAPQGLGAAFNAEDKFDWAPNPTSVYPDYLENLDVLVCLSVNLNIISNGVFAGLPSNADSSYVYPGYLVDLADGGDPVAYAPDVGNGGVILSKQLFEMLTVIRTALDRSETSGDYSTLVDVLERNIVVPAGEGNLGSCEIVRWRDGIERFLITDINDPTRTVMGGSVPPVMWDKFVGDSKVATADSHRKPLGGNVLYLDGHVEFRKYHFDGVFPINQHLAEALAWAGLEP